MKQYLRIFSMLLLMLIGIGGGDVFGAETTKTSTLTFTKACSGSGTADDGVTWSVTSDAAESTFESTKGIHYGTGSKAVSYLQLSTSNITGPIKEIVVNAAGASATSAKLNVTIGGTAIGSEKSITATATDYTFSASDPLTGTIIVKLSQESAKKALYVKSIKVTYVSSSEPSSDLLLSQSSGAVNMGSTLDISSFVTTASGYEGTISYTVTSGADVASVDANGVITGLAIGTATIEVKAAAVSGKFAESKQDFTITVKDPNTIVFNSNNSSFTNIPSGYGSAADCVFTGSDGNNYTFNCARVMKSTVKIQMEKNAGTITSPAFESTYGYKVNVYYYTSNNGTPLSITCGSLSANGQATGVTPNSDDGTGYIATLSIPSTSASFEIKAGGKACYVSKIEVSKFTEPQKKEAVVTFPKASYTTFPGESFTAPTASVKNAEGEAISGAKVTYSISGDDIATIDANTGAVTPKADALGTATITATFAGDANYKEATGSYTLAIKEVTVASDIANLITQGTADNTKLYSINLTQAQVLKVHGSGIYVSNGTSFVAVKSLTNDAVVEGKLLSGKLIGKYSLSYYVPTLTLETEPTLTIEDGISTLAGTSISADEAEDHINELVTISGTTSISSSKQYLGDVQLFNKYSLSYAAPYTGSKLSIRGVIIKYNSQLQILPLTKYDIIYHFDEAKDNAVGDAADVKVQLTRTLSKDYWNTFCVPFSMKAKQIAATFGEGTKVTKYSTTDGTTLNFTEATEITAGVPYLIKPAATTANPSIEGVTIANTTAAEMGSTYKFIGIYSPKALATDGTELFIGTDSQLYSPAEGKNTINGMRAYLNVPAGTEGARLNILGEMVTAIDGVSLNGNDEVKVFNLKGQRVGNTTKGLAKGIYVVNGKKMVINK